ncbi:MAG: peptidyl-prolyl cis-trans isomerase [Deferribacterales bacterium]
MLRHFRNQKKILSIFLWIVIASFIGTIFLVWGVGGKGNQKTYAMKINDHVISFNEYKKTYENISQTFKQLFGTDIDQKMLTGKVIDEITSKYLLMDEAINLKIPVTDQEVLEEIKKIPAFQSNGTFDKNRYIEVLRLNGITPEIFENDIRSNILLTKIKGLIVSTVFVKDEEVLKEYKFRNKIAEVSYVQLNVENFKNQVSLSDNDIVKFYNENKNRFLEPVKIKARYVELSPDNINVTDNISDKDLESYYLKNKEKFKQDEQIKTRHILIRINDFNDNKSVQEALKKANDIYKKAISGKKFEDLARKYSDDISKNTGGDLGFVKRGMMVKEFEDALFQLKEGEISKPVKSPFGYHIIKNEKYLPQKEITFLEAKNDIKKLLMQEKLQQKYREYVQNKYKEITSYSDLASFVQKDGHLTLKETELLTEKSTSAIITPEVKNILFNMDKGEMSNLIQMNGKYYVFEIIERIEPTIPPLEQIKDKVKEAASYAAAEQLLRKKAEEALKKADINEVSVLLNIPAKDLPPFKRKDPIPNIGVNSEITSAIFTTKPGKLVNKLFLHGTNFYIFQVKSIKDSLMDEFENQKDIITQYILNLKQTEAYNSYINNLKKNAKIDIEPSLLN